MGGSRSRGISTKVQADDTLESGRVVRVSRSLGNLEGRKVGIGLFTSAKVLRCPEELEEFRRSWSPAWILIPAPLYEPPQLIVVQCPWSLRTLPTHDIIQGRVIIFNERGMSCKYLLQIVSLRSACRDSACTHLNGHHRDREDIPFFRHISAF